jgi:hypothetical protein
MTPANLHTTETPLSPAAFDGVTTRLLPAFEARFAALRSAGP